MQRKKCLFFMRVYNDIDHLTPVAWKMHCLGHDVSVVLLDNNRNLDILTDPRFLFLISECNISVSYYYAVKESGFRLPNVNLALFMYPLISKIYRRFLDILDTVVFNDNWAQNVIERLRPDVCVFDIQKYNPQTIAGKFMKAIKQRGTPIIAAPHGLNIFINHDFAPRPFRSDNVSRLPLRNLPFDIYDIVIEQNPDRLSNVQREGFDLKKVRVLGSARYCHEWISVCKQIYKPYVPKKNCPTDFLKIVFFLPRWDQSVEQLSLLRTLNEISDFHDIFLVVKEHTREGAGRLPNHVRQNLMIRKNVEISDESQSSCINCTSKNSTYFAPSFSITQWADVVINFGSSIGLDALVLNKILLNPIYLHPNVTIFDHYKSSIVIRSSRELVDVIRKIRAGDSVFPCSPSECLNKVVYGGREPHDVLTEYCKTIVDYKCNEQGLADNDTRK